ncbi:hypothetical protein PybrP1_002070 [[Pythium] brassicae (nom. inval.)]|nr:hypothetical protein PybrP1_002070 [[Pythium] brassicae (nom. inval.)]
MRADSPTDRGLTFLQSAREQNIPVRSGKWNLEEEDYLRKLVELFCLGVLDEVPQKTSMRAWLSRMLNCCPMRISKKQMHGEKFKGKAKFAKSSAAIDRMTQREYDDACDQICRLRVNFLKHWAKDEFARRSTREKTIGFEDWYSQVLDIVPHPKIAKNSRLTEFKQRRPEPESITTLQAQLEETLAREKHQRMEAFAWSGRSLKRQRMDGGSSCYGELVGFPDLVAGVYPPVVCESPDPAPLGSTFGIFLKHETAPELGGFMLAYAEPDLSMAKIDPFVEFKIPSTRSVQEIDGAFPEIECEDQFCCSEYLSPRNVKVAPQLDFGLPSKWNHHDPRDLPSRELSIWEDNDLLLDGFALLADQPLWDDTESWLNASGTTAGKACYPVAPY